MSWRPLLSGDLRVRAGAAIDAIVDDQVYKIEEASDHSLGSGNAGLAILSGYLFLTGFRPDGAAAAKKRLANCLAAMTEQPADASLYGGLTGVGWALAHLHRYLPNLDGESDLAEIDRALIDHLQESPWKAEYDLVSGLVGFGVYSLERLPRPSGHDSLKLILTRLIESSEEQPDGTAWWTNPDLLPSQQRQQCPRGYYNVGVAHGVPGVIGLLTQYCSAGVEATQAREMLTESLRWLRNQQTPEGFPAWTTPGQPAEPARLAWCYGDPGVALTWLAAAHAVDQRTWEHEALAIARRACQRPRESGGVVDAGLCHGAAGLAHLYNRAFQATGESSLADAARYWFKRTLAMCRPGRGVGGFEAWHPGKNGDSKWVAEPGFLTGSAGIALALLAATTDVEPQWDRVLLTNVPPRNPKG